MTKPLRLTFAILLLILASCKKDAKQEAKALIVGKWFWAEQTYDFYTNDTVTVHTDYTTTLDPLGYFEFNADGTFVQNPLNRNGQYLYGKYSITGNTLYIKLNGDIDPSEATYTIKTLASSKLVYHETISQPPFRTELEYTMKK